MRVKYAVLPINMPSTQMAHKNAYQHADVLVHIRQAWAWFHHLVPELSSGYGEGGQRGELGQAVHKVLKAHT